MTAIQRECLDLIDFYDERGWDWTSALAFTLCKDLFNAGGGFRCHPIEGFRCYPFPKQRKIR